MIEIDTHACSGMDEDLDPALEGSERRVSSPGGEESVVVDLPEFVYRDADGTAPVLTLAPDALSFRLCGDGCEVVVDSDEERIRAMDEHGNQFFSGFADPEFEAIVVRVLRSIQKSLR